MFNLILVVMSIVLASLASLASINYLNPSAIIKHKTSNSLSEAFVSLESSWNLYADDNETFSWSCDTFTTTEGAYEDCQKVKTADGILPVGSWSSNLFPRYGFLPQPFTSNFKDAFSWSYGVNASGHYFCLEANSLMPIHVESTYKTQSEMPFNKIIVSETCGDSVNSAVSAINGSNLTATFWLTRK